MKKSFIALVTSLKKISGQFDEAANQQKQLLFKEISKLKLPASRELISYSEVILFTLAHPADEKLQRIAEKENLRIAVFMKNVKPGVESILSNSGLPFSFTQTRFSHDCIRWLFTHPHGKVEMDGFENPKLTLNEVLKLTLPSLEVSETSAGLDNTDLLETYGVKKQHQLPFIVNELSRFDDQPLVKDLLYDALDIYVNVIPSHKNLSKAYNRLLNPPEYFHTEIRKNFNFRTLLDTPLRNVAGLSAEAQKQAIATIKNSMLLTGRETDTATYMDVNSFRLYHLERGTSVAIYGMVPQRQLPLESYVGYTLFKNGFPAAYGGAWVFGKRALFGINVFEQFRGGESGFILCQLLRVYRQVFGVSYFEVEPYQYGLDNPEGIQSGAFWFYYRYGFRSLDKKLFSIAEKENEKRKSKKDYRTSEKTLIQFTESNIALNLGKGIPIRVLEITRKVTAMIQKNYAGNRIVAEKDCMRRFVVKTDLPDTLNKTELQVLKEVALWAEAFNIVDAGKLALLCEMIKIKPVDLEGYQQVVMGVLGR